MNNNMERVLVNIELVSWEYIKNKITNDEKFAKDFSDNDWYN